MRRRAPTRRAPGGSRPPAPPSPRGGARTWRSPPRRRPRRTRRPTSFATALALPPVASARSGRDGERGHRGAHGIARPPELAFSRRVSVKVLARQPDRAEVDRAHPGRTAPRGSPRTISVEPPPTSTTAGRLPAAHGARDRPVVGEASLLVRRQDEHRQPRRLGEGGHEAPGRAALTTRGGHDRLRALGTERPSDLRVALARARHGSTVSRESVPRRDLRTQPEPFALLLDRRDAAVGEDVRHQDARGVRSDVEDRDAHPRDPDPRPGRRRRGGVSRYVGRTSGL